MEEKLLMCKSCFIKQIHEKKDTQNIPLSSNRKKKIKFYCYSLQECLTFGQ